MNPAKPKKNKAEPGIGQPASQPTTSPTLPRFRRNEANAKLAYANFFNVSSTREETALTFGMVQASPSPEEEVLVEVSSRVVLTPRSAKRLHLMLGQVLEQYESRFGSLSAESK